LVEACGTQGRKINSYIISVDRPDGKGPLGRPKCRLCNIKMDIKERGLNTVDWILMTQDRKVWWDVVKITMRFCVPYDPSRFLTN
jgi:hypothetical protein